MAQPASRKSDYRYFAPLTSRWSDNDVYGHINNVAYYSYFDSAANHFLITRAGLDIVASTVIGLVVESKCTFARALAYPDALTAGVRVDRLGKSSLTWGLAVFSEEADEAAAEGYVVHVFVDRVTRRPVEIPTAMRAALATITR